MLFLKVVFVCVIINLCECSTVSVYVATSGTNNPNCSASLPCSTLSQALEALPGGTTAAEIYFSGGTYSGNETIGVSLPVGVSITLTSQSLSSSVVFLCDSSSPTGIIYSGDSPLSINGLELQSCTVGVSANDTSSVSVTHTTFQGSFSAMDIIASAVSLSNVTFLDTSNTTINVLCDSLTIDSCSFADNSQCSIKGSVTGELNIEQSTFNKTGGLCKLDIGSGIIRNSHFDYLNQYESFTFILYYETRFELLDSAFVCDPSIYQGVDIHGNFGSEPSDFTTAVLRGISTIDCLSGLSVYGNLNLSDSSVVSSFYPISATTFASVVIDNVEVIDGIEKSDFGTSGGLLLSPYEFLNDTSIIIENSYFWNTSILCGSVSTGTISNCSFSQIESQVLQLGMASWTIENTIFTDMKLPERGFPSLISVQSNSKGSVIDSCIFSHTNSTFGTLSPSFGNFEIKNCTFYDLISDNYGGAIYTSNYDSITITNSNFTNCRAPQGGAMFLMRDGGSVNIIGSTFSSNLGENSGGAVLAMGVLNVSSSTFSNNIASTTLAQGSIGGALYFNSFSNVTVENCQFIDNQADTGAALGLEQVSALSPNAFIAEVTVTVTSSTFTGNQATHGAVFGCDVGDSLIVNVDIDDDSNTLEDNNTTDGKDISCGSDNFWIIVGVIVGLLALVVVILVVIIAAAVYMRAKKKSQYDAIDSD